MATSDDRRSPPTGTPASGSPATEGRQSHAERATLRREARLARLKLDPEREQTLSVDLARILTAFASLQQVDVSDLEPLHHPLHASLAGAVESETADPIAAGVGPSRRDTRLTPPDPDSAADRDRLLAGAPEPIDGHFGVPKTIEQ
jgi:aspartyl/glutamyl-tRNA(Asn/Gln) amidotransferase C subunit